MQFPASFDVIVIGGGHAGTEAALAAARSGARTLLLTHNIETLGAMSCNPSIGGIGKGHLVKEVDALGGAMAAAADEAGIQFRILNASKGPAVRATRAQADRQLYKHAIRGRLENQHNLTLFQQAADDLILSGDRVSGVVTQLGIRFQAPTVVLTAGTFLNGLVHVGLSNYRAGRFGDPAAISLAERLKEIRLPVGRLKTGTPPRLDGRSIDYSLLQEQAGDDPVPVFSFLGNRNQHPRQVSCWIAHTNSRTHDIIRSGLDRSPMFTGVIEGVGPRYCPSIEDKIHRFAGKDSHQIFIEPEGLDTHEVYPQGVSTSLPFDVQLALVRSVRGLENVHITRPGYAIEYDYFDPRNLKDSLETKSIGGLFFAGQINGTTGYEEAAAQGLLAGINASRLARQLPASAQPTALLALMRLAATDPEAAASLLQGGWAQRLAPAFAATAWAHVARHAAFKQSTSAAVYGRQAWQARDAGTHRELNRQFREREPVKRYLAQVAPLPAWDEISLEAPLKVNADRAHRTRVDMEKGKPARTDFLVLRREANWAELECRLHSGVSHQIRAHLYHLGLGILGDPLYQPPQFKACSKPERERMMLHACYLSFTHPRTGELMQFSV